MSIRVESSPIIPESAATPRAVVRRSGAAAWARLVAVATLLATSGGVRAWQERRVERTLSEGRVSPFPLAEIPMELGSWEGSSATLDPQIVRISGSSDLITRRYVDRRTGTTVVVVVNFGPATDMLGHVPELCYPSAGYEQDGPAIGRPIVPEGGGAPVPFRSLVYTKGSGGLAETQEVYYSLCYDGRWTTEARSPKASRRIGGMYKVQICRRAGREERRDIDNPCEPFAALILAEIEARAARGRATKPNPRP